VDWSALLGLMGGCGAVGPRSLPGSRAHSGTTLHHPSDLPGRGRIPQAPGRPCGLKTDAERARHVRKFVREMRNSRGEWEPVPRLSEVPVADIRIYDLRLTIDAPRDQPAIITSRPILSEAAALEKVGTGALCVLSETGEGPVYGRALRWRSG